MNSDSIDEDARKRFEAAWLEGRPQPIERFLPLEDDARYLATLEELVHIDLELQGKSWRDPRQQGSATAAQTAAPPRVETYLRRFPQLNRPEIVRRLRQQESLLRKPAGDCVPETIGRTADTSTRDARQGRFGNYELLEVIGRGGMGVVYRARQCTADRVVALKVIRRDRLESLPRDSKSTAIDRFWHEVRAAARLDHENIVTLYEVGEVDGEPFFSMKYVEGRSLAEIVREKPVPGRAAAEYMEAVARGVEEAHHHGVLHRDLKPQNILVESQTGRPLVADFGLAKLLESSPDLTEAGEVMGSPSYMSPEQSLDSSRVTAQTDVYAMGATLYHLLTGRPPFCTATNLETLRQVIDQEPVAPQKLNPAVDRDLETICLKCLQKEPSRRYGSAEMFADDLRSYLRGDPIRPRPVGALERSWLWCRRKPVLALLIGSTALFLASTLVATAIGYWKTSAALTVAEAAQQQSEASYREARGMVDRFFTRVSEDMLLNQPDTQPLRIDLLQEALAYYQRFLAQRGEDPAIRDDVALTHFRIGRISEEIDSLDEALASYRRAVEMQQQLAAEDPSDADCLQALGNTWTAVGTVLCRQGKLPESQTAHQEAAAVRQQLVGRAADDPEANRMLANSYMNLGVVARERGLGDEAERQFVQAQALRQRILDSGGDAAEVRRDLGMGWYNLANLANARRDYRAAQEYFGKATAIFEALVRSNPKDLNNQYRLVVCYRMLADLKCVTADPDAAANIYQKALRRQQALTRANPRVHQFQAALAGLQMNIGEFEREQDRPETARESLQQALEILKTLVDEFPKVPQYRRDLAVTLLAIARLQATDGQSAAARENLETAKALLTELLTQWPKGSPSRADCEEQLAKTDKALRALPDGPPERK